MGAPSGCKRERAGDFRAAGFGWRDVGGAVSGPAAACLGEFEFFVADGFAVELNGEFTFVLGEDGRAGGRCGGGFFLGGDRERGADEENRHRVGENFGTEAGGLSFHCFPLFSQCGMEIGKCADAIVGMSTERYGLTQTENGNWKSEIGQEQSAATVLGLRLIDDEVRFAGAAGDDVEAENFGDDAGGFAGAVDAMIGELIGRQALRMERAEAGFVAEERAAGHGHAAGEQDFDGSVEPDDGNAGGAKKFGRALLGVSAAAEGEHDRFFEFEDAAERGAKLIGFDLAKGGFAEALENFGDAHVRRRLRCDRRDRRSARRAGARGACRRWSCRSP